MNVANLSNMKQLDKEWIELIAAARSMELSINEIRAFLHRPAPMTDHPVHIIAAESDVASHKALS